MIRVSPADFARDIERYRNLARTEVVVVSSNGEDTAVLISAEEYQRLKRRDRQVLGLEDFSDAEIAAIEGATAPEQAKAFDEEVAS